MNTKHQKKIRQRTKLVLGIFLIGTIVASLSGVVFLSNAQKKEQIERTSYVQKELKIYNSKSRFNISINNNYQEDTPQFPSKLDKLKEILPVLSYMQKAVTQEMDVESYATGLVDYGLIVEKTPNSFSNKDYKNNSNNVFYVKGKTGYSTIRYSANTSGMLTALYLDVSYFPINTQEGYSKIHQRYQTYNRLLTKLKSEMGPPHVTFTDELYPYDVSINYYFDKGLAFYNGYLILFKPRDSIDENLIIREGLDFTRSVNGPHFDVRGN